MTRANRQIHGWDPERKFRKILRSRQFHVDLMYAIFSKMRFQSLCQRFRHGSIIEQDRYSKRKCQLRLSAKSLGSILAHLIHPTLQFCSGLLGVGTQCPLHRRCLRYDISRSAGMQRTNGKDRHLRRRRLSGNQFLQAKVDVTGNVDRINRELRPCAMAAFSSDLNSKAITGGHCRPRCIVKGAGIPGSRRVHSNGGIHFRIFQDACINHSLGALSPLFICLEHELYCTVQFLLPAGQDRRCAQQHSGMHIVATGMGFSIIF